MTGDVAALAAVLVAGVVLARRAARWAGSLFRLDGMDTREFPGD